MRKRPQATSAEPPPDAAEPPHEEIKTVNNAHLRRAQRSGFVVTVLLVLFKYSSWGVYYYQFESMPPPLSSEQAGKRGFSEIAAMEHVKTLTQLGPHPVGSDALDRAVQVRFIQSIYNFVDVILFVTTLKIKLIIL